MWSVVADLARWIAEYCVLINILFITRASTTTKGLLPPLFQMLKKKIRSQLLALAYWGKRFRIKMSMMSSVEEIFLNSRRLALSLFSSTKKK